MRMRSHIAPIFRLAGIGIAVLFVAHRADARWMDNAWTYRRAVDVIWDDQKATGDELAMVDVYTAGHHKPDGSDIRVALELGKIVPSHVLMAGPGDRVRVVFALSKSIRRYYVYFGNPNPPAPA